MSLLCTKLFIIRFTFGRVKRQKSQHRRSGTVPFRDEDADRSNHPQKNTNVRLSPCLPRTCRVARKYKVNRSCVHFQVTKIKQYRSRSTTQGRSAGLVPCSDHGSDALMWAAGRGHSESELLEELIKLTGGAGIDRENHLGGTALTIACSRRETGSMCGWGDVGVSCRRGESTSSAVLQLYPWLPDTGRRLESCSRTGVRRLFPIGRDALLPSVFCVSFPFPHDIFLHLTDLSNRSARNGGKRTLDYTHKVLSRF